MSDHDLAARLATQAGQLLLRVREELAGARPGDAVLSEEGADDPVRLRAERVWIVDPLDGTREFAEAGRDDWAVHVALCAAGELLVGAVARAAGLRTSRIDGSALTYNRGDPLLPDLVVCRPEYAEAVLAAIG